MIAARFAKPAISSPVRSAVIPRLVVAGATMAIVLLGGVAWAQGTFRLGWNSCAVGASNSVLDVCTTGGTLVTMFTPGVAMNAGNMDALFEIRTSPQPGGPPVPNYILNCLVEQPYLVHATCLAADRLLAPTPNNECKIYQIQNPVDGDASRVRFRVMANRKINQGNPLVAGHEYQAFAISFPPHAPADPGCEGCNVPFRVYVVRDSRHENQVGPHYGMGLRAQLTGTGCPVPVFLTPSDGAPCISGNQACNAPLAVDDRSRPNALGLSCAPNPTRDVLRLSYTLSMASEVDLFVADLAGRSVLRLESGLRSPGVHALTWDGRDQLGRRLAPGVYWATLRAEGLRSAVRVVMSR